MEWKKFDIKDKTTYPKSGVYLLWLYGEPRLARFHLRPYKGGRWWDYDYKWRFVETDIKHYCEVIKPKKIEKITPKTDS